MCHSPMSHSQMRRVGAREHVSLHIQHCKSTGKWYGDEIRSQEHRYNPWLYLETITMSNHKQSGVCTVYLHVSECACVDEWFPAPHPHPPLPSSHFFLHLNMSNLFHNPTSSPWLHRSTPAPSSILHWRVKKWSTVKCCVLWLLLNTGWVLRGKATLLWHPDYHGARFKGSYWWF